MSQFGFSERQKFGLVGEKWAVNQLKRRGYDARLISSFFANFDILIDGLLLCEVKLSRFYLRTVRKGYYRPTWHFDVGRVPGNVDSLIILICEDEKGQWWPYIVPSWFLLGRSSVAITSHPSKYKGFLAKCLKNWSYVPEVLYYRQKHSNQLLLPLGV
jgi:hypothetical protein